MSGFEFLPNSSGIGADLPDEPAVPAMWWSPSLADRRNGLGFIRQEDGRLVDGRGIGLGRHLPADAIRLLPSEGAS